MQHTVLRNYIFLGAILLAVITVIIIAIASFQSISRRDKVAVTISVVPSDAKVTVNDRLISTGTAYLDPGTTVIEVSKPGFVSFSRTMHIDASTKTIAIPLTPSTPETQEWSRNNKAKYAQLEGVAGKAAQEQGSRFRSLNPIVSKLPYKNLLYTIGYRSDQEDPTGNSIIIEIDAPEGYKQAALYQIRQWGYDPTNFTINFRGYTNPFSL